MAQAKYSKLGYGNAEDVEAAIALGMLDGRDKFNEPRPKHIVSGC